MNFNHEFQKIDYILYISDIMILNIYRNFEYNFKILLFN